MTQCLSPCDLDSISQRLWSTEGTLHSSCWWSRDKESPAE